MNATTNLSFTKVLERTPSMSYSFTEANFDLSLLLNLLDMEVFSLFIQIDKKVMLCRQLNRQLILYQNSLQT